MLRALWSLQQTTTSSSAAPEVARILPLVLMISLVARPAATIPQPALHKLGKKRSLTEFWWILHDPVAR